jgi:hypothetical protein
LSNLNQIQKEYLKTVTNVEQCKKLKRQFKVVNKEINGLTEDQIYCLDNTIYTDSARKKLIKIFREENLIINLNQSVN